MSHKGKQFLEPGYYIWAPYVSKVEKLQDLSSSYGIMDDSPFIILKVKEWLFYHRKEVGMVDLIAKEIDKHILEQTMKLGGKIASRYATKEVNPKFYGVIKINDINT